MDVVYGRFETIRKFVVSPVCQVMEGKPAAFHLAAVMAGGDTRVKTSGYASDISARNDVV